MARRLLLFVCLIVLGAGPALAVLLIDRPRPDPWPALDAQAAARATILDERVSQWFAMGAQVATDLENLFVQLKDRKLGPAAKGTLQLFLQKRLARHAESFVALAVIDEGKKTWLNTGPAPPQRWLTELGHGVLRPSIAIAGPPSTSTLVVTAPLSVGADKRAVLVAQLKTEPLQSLLRSTWLQLALVDAEGGQLSEASFPSGLKRYGTESAAGRAVWQGRPLRYTPLRSARMTLLALGAAPKPSSPWRPWHMGLAIAVLLAAVGTTAVFGRSKP